MTQEANKNEKSKVPFLEDALDNLDAPQVDSSDLGENSIGDDLDTLDLGGITLIMMTILSYLKDRKLTLTTM
jgi:hypothetical protein